MNDTILMNKSYKDILDDIVIDIIEKFNSCEFKEDDSVHANINKLVISCSSEIAYYDYMRIENFFEKIGSLLDDKVSDIVYNIHKLFHQQFRLEDIYNINIEDEEIYSYVKKNFTFPYQDLKLDKQLFDKYLYNINFLHISKVAEKFDKIFQQIITTHRIFTNKDIDLLLYINDNNTVFNECLFENITFTNKYDRVCFHSQFNNCTFKNIEIKDTHFCFKMAQFNNCSFKDCNLGNLYETKFVHSTFNKCNFNKCFTFSNELVYDNVESIEQNEHVLLQLCRYIDKQNGKMKDCIFNDYTIPNIKDILSFESSLWE